MPNILQICTPDWELLVWSRSIKQKQRRLRDTLEARQTQISPSTIRFLTPVKILSAEVEGEAICIPDTEKFYKEFDVPLPIFFENTLYEFEFLFTIDGTSSVRGTPRTTHKLRAINDAFHFSSRKVHSLRGSINFGNDIGWFRLPMRYFRCEKLVDTALSFQVMPTKIDMAADLESIHQRIDQHYPLWRFALATKTEQSAQRSLKPRRPFLLLWLAEFESLRDQLECGVKIILNSPHSRLVSFDRATRIDRLKGRLAPRLNEKVHESINDERLDKRFVVQPKNLSVDTPENRFIKMVLEVSCKNLIRFEKAARLQDRAPANGRLSDSFFEQLTKWRKPLERFRNFPLFHDVGSFGGLSKESLVLQQRVGYASVYRVWQQLKLYLDVMGDQASISMRSVAKLYEVWCFLEIRQQLLDLGFVETKISRLQMQTKGLERKPRDGSWSSFNFSRPDGITIRLTHEPVFSNNPNKSIGETYSWTTTQIPDILLQATFSSGEKLIWLFDAKYKISSSDQFDNGGVDDLVPEDAINQMHRYRDALINLYPEDGGGSHKCRPIRGAYALYPGFWPQTAKNITKNPYFQAIQEIGIGAFPLLPSQKNSGEQSSGNAWLKAFLEEQLGRQKNTQYNKALADRYFVEDAVRIPISGMQQQKYSDLTLVATAAPKAKRASEYTSQFIEGKAEWYHMRLKASDRDAIERNIIFEVRFCAIATSDYGTHERKVSWVYPVKSVELKRRRDLTIAQTGSINESDDFYWLFSFGTAFKLTTLIEGFPVRGHHIKLTLLTELGDLTRFNTLPAVYSEFIGTR